MDAFELQAELLPERGREIHAPVEVLVIDGSDKDTDPN
jgi:hypothetical protein